MKIFITGGTGFIGTHVVKQLAQTEHELFCLARKTSNTQILREAGVNIIIGDITEKGSLVKGMQGCQWCANIASLYEFWVKDAKDFRKTNVEGIRNVMEAAITTGITKMIHVSTAAVYGNAIWPVTENSELGVKHSGKYDLTKREGELVAWDLYKTKKLPLVMVYPGAVIGPNDPKATGRYIKNLISGRMPVQVLTKSIFPFVYVGDVAKGIINVLEKENNIGEKYLLVAENLTFQEINKTVAELTGKKLPVIRLPDWFTITGAYIVTAISNIIKKPPILDLSTGQIRIMKRGLEVDGSKAERELGITYTPIREALKEAIESIK